MNDVNEALIPLFGIVFTFSSIVAVLCTWLGLNYRKRRRLMELHHTERMAAIERGMDLPPLPIELIDGRAPRRRRRSSLLPGLVWFFVGLAIVIGLISAGEHDIPMYVALVPLAVGTAYLLYYFFEGRKTEALMLEHDLAQRPNGGQTSAV